MTDVGRVAAAVGVGDLGAAVVAGEDDDGVVGDADLLEAVEDAADAVVERRDHRGVDALALVVELREALVVGVGGLERRVRRVERDVEEEGLGAVAIDERDRFLRELIGDVLLELCAGSRPRTSPRRASRAGSSLSPSPGGCARSKRARPSKKWTPGQLRSTYLVPLAMPKNSSKPRSSGW